jgi:hypothetical protein
MSANASTELGSFGPKLAMPLNFERTATSASVAPIRNGRDWGALLLGGFAPGERQVSAEAAVRRAIRERPRMVDTCRGSHDPQLAIQTDLPVAQRRPSVNRRAATSR